MSQLFCAAVASAADCFTWISQQQNPPRPAQFKTTEKNARFRDSPTEQREPHLSFTFQFVFKPLHILVGDVSVVVGVDSAQSLKQCGGAMATGGLLNQRATSAAHGSDLHDRELFRGCHEAAGRQLEDRQLFRGRHGGATRARI